MEQLLTPVEVAAELGMDQRTLANWRAQKQGPRYLKIGNRVRYRRSDLDQWLQSREIQARADNGAGG